MTKPKSKFMSAPAGERLEMPVSLPIGSSNKEAEAAFRRRGSRPPTSSPTPPSLSSPGSDMTKDPFSTSTKAQISLASNNHCVCCLRELDDVGQCTHILDSAEHGSKILTWAQVLGLLPANFERSSSANGLKMCSSCHLDIFTPGLAIFSPPHELLQYLIDCVESNPNIPIHDVLLSHLEGPGLPDGPDPSAIKPFLDLYIIVPLKPTRLKCMEFVTYHDPELSWFLDGKWTVPCPDDVQVDDDTTISDSALKAVKIFDAASIPTGDRGHAAHIDLSLFPAENVNYWRLPTKIGPVLAYLIYGAMTHPFLDSVEIELAKRLGTLLMSKRSTVSATTSQSTAPRSPTHGRGSKRRRDRDNDSNPDDNGPRKKQTRAKTHAKAGSSSRC